MKLINIFDEPASTVKKNYLEHEYQYKKNKKRLSYKEKDFL